MSTRAERPRHCVLAPLSGVPDWVLAVCSSLAFAAAFPPVSWAFLAPLGYLVLVVLAARERIGLGTWLSLGGVTTIMWLWFEWWLAQVAWPGLVVLCIMMAAYWILALWLLRRVKSTALGQRLPWAVLAPMVIVACEWLRASIVLDGYPWFLIGQAVIDWPIAQCADLGGVPLLTLLIVTTTGALVDALQGRHWPIVSALALAVGGTLYGQMRLGEYAAHGSIGPTVLAVQTNLPVSNSAPWPREQQESDVNTFARDTLTMWDEAKVLGSGVDLIVWPETILPGFGLEPETLRLLEEGGWWPGKRFARIAETLVARTQAQLLVGSPVYFNLHPDGDRWGWTRHTNSAYLLSPDGTRARYDKLFLTPFGETMPIISRWEWLEQQLLSISAVGMTFDLDVGADPAPLPVRYMGDGADRVCFTATPICFEDTVASVVRSMAYAADGTKRAQAIVNISNDGWFGRSDAGREHHALMARWRCIELRLPMVRVANTGISAGYDSSGRQAVGARIAPRSKGGFTYECGLDDRETLYGRLGDVLSPLMFIATAVLAGLSFRRGSSGNASMLAAVALVPLLAALPGCAGSSTAGALGGSVAGGGAWSSRETKPDPSLIRAKDETAQLEPIAEAPDPQVASAPLEPAPPVVAPNPVVAEAAPVADPAVIETSVPSSRLDAPNSVDPVPVEPAKTVQAAAVPSEAAVRPAAVTPLEPAGNDSLSRAITILLRASESDQPLYRVHALEGLEHSREYLQPVVRRHLADENPGVRFAAAVIVGRRHLYDCADVVEPLALDPDASVRAAALYALVCLGRIVDITPLAQLVMSDDARTRSNTLLVFGELRNASAIPLVESVVGRRLEVDDPVRARIVDLQAAEALIKMGDYRQYDPIRAALFAPSEESEIVALACQMVGEVEDRGARGHLIGIWNAKGHSERPIEVRLIAGASLARIGEPNLEPILQLCQSAAKDSAASVRAQAAATLGWVGGEKATILLAGLLDDKAPLVRLNAAASLVRLGH